jgi:hypothetical protein
MQILQEQKSALVQNALHFVNLTASSPYIVVLNNSGAVLLTEILMVPGAGLIVTALGLLQPLRGFVAALLVQNALHFVNLTASSPYIVVLNNSGAVLLTEILMVPGAGLIVTALGLLQPLRGFVAALLVQNALHFVNLTASSPYIVVLNNSGAVLLTEILMVPGAGLEPARP